MNSKKDSSFPSMSFSSCSCSWTRGRWRQDHEMKRCGEEKCGVQEKAKKESTKDVYFFCLFSRRKEGKKDERSSP